MTPKEKKFAALAPPKDKITLADKIAGATMDKAKKGIRTKKKKAKKKKGGGMAGLSAAQKEVYRRGLAAYMSSGNRPKVSQHAWAMARVSLHSVNERQPRLEPRKAEEKVIYL